MIEIFTLSVLSGRFWLLINIFPSLRGVLVCLFFSVSSVSVVISCLRVVILLVILPGCSRSLLVVIIPLWWFWGHCCCFAFICGLGCHFLFFFFVFLQMFLCVFDDNFAFLCGWFVSPNAFVVFFLVIILKSSLPIWCLCDHFVFTCGHFVSLAILEDEFAEMMTGRILYCKFGFPFFMAFLQLGLNIPRLEMKLWLY